MPPPMQSVEAKDILNLAMATFQKCAVFKQHAIVKIYVSHKFVLSTFQTHRGRGGGGD